MEIVLIAVIGVVVLVGLVLIGVYNGLVGTRNKVQEAASQIDVQLKRRYDLIPNLVAAVKGQMEFESGTLERITQARAGVAATQGAINPERASAENALGGLLAGLRIQVEAYPALRSNENVVALQEQLSTTENQISFSRQHYNACVMNYRNATQTFPNSLIAGSFGFSAEAFAFFDTPEGSEATPVVDLSLGK